MVPTELKVPLEIPASVSGAHESDDSKVLAAATPLRCLCKVGGAEYSGVHYLAG
jgi:hypothetical protein